MAKANFLGKLQGIIASAKERSRNNRLYTEGFWDKKFNSDLFKEGLDNKVILGQLYHPDDDEEYSQIHLDDRSAVVLLDVKKDNLDYIGTFGILPTQAGQCLRNLLDIGCIVGVSSRGLADHDVTTYDESIADTYDLITWDIVAYPGIKSCRLHEIGAVAESFNRREINKTKIMESLDELKSEDKFYNNFINDAIKLKEEFDNQLQIEDIMAKYGITDDLIDYGNYVTINDKNIPVYDDGIHGLKEVLVYSDDGLGDLLTYDGLESQDMYLVDDVLYDENKDVYIASGEWIKIN